MYFAIRLSFVLAVLFCLTGNGNARMLGADFNRLQQLQRRSHQSNDANTQLKIAYEVIEIYDKYKGQKGSDLLREAQLNSEVNDFKRKNVVIDGVPAQGGKINDVAKKISDEIPDEVKKNAKDIVVKIAKSVTKSIFKYFLN
ncbi:protein Turandot Z [Drosophila santomea]|uniref:protein Turandot Z n=1 Tax=Drosophila santomea TaxID=129105 RepID=UPI001953968A|nr:protein Turandot Z [Drosophila santomea]